DAGDLVRGDTRADPTATDQHAAPPLAAQHLLADRTGEVRVVHGFEAVGANVDHVVPLLFEVRLDDFLQLESGVVRSDDDFHQPFLPLRSAFACSTTFSTVKPYSFIRR